MIEENAESEAIYQLTKHRGWKVLENLIKEEEARLFKKFLNARKDDSFRDIQGEVKGLKKVLQIVQARSQNFESTRQEPEILQERQFAQARERYSV